MKEKEVFEKNLTLSAEFSRYLLEHPEFAEQLPQKAHIVFLPKYDHELYPINLKGAEAHRKERGDDLPTIFIEVEDLAPARSRLIGPCLVRADQLEGLLLRESKATYSQDRQDKAKLTRGSDGTPTAKPE